MRNTNESANEVAKSLRENGVSKVGACLGMNVVWEFLLHCVHLWNDHAPAWFKCQAENHRPFASGHILLQNKISPFS
jgi:hypothetical protein